MEKAFRVAVDVAARDLFMVGHQLASDSLMEWYWSVCASGLINITLDEERTGKSSLVRTK